LQGGNQVGVAAVCRFIAFILEKVKLTTVRFDHEPSACVSHDAWRSEGLPNPPSEVVAEGWKVVLRLLRVRRIGALYLNLSRAQLTSSPRPARSSATA
jgi:hypothetical protein